MAGAAALALPELDRVLPFEGVWPEHTRQALERGRARHAGGHLRAHHPDRRERARRYRSTCVGVHRSRAWRAGSRRHARRTPSVWPPLTTPLSARGAKRFVDLAPAEQDAVLRSLEGTPFFALVRAHTIQGTFCDPAYGGNANFVGWDLIGYPGVRLNVTAADQRMGVADQAGSAVGVRLRDVCGEEHMSHADYSETDGHRHRRHGRSRRRGCASARAGRTRGDRPRSGHMAHVEGLCARRAAE